MRRAAIGLAAVSLAAGTFLTAPSAQADPEACAAVWPAPCTYNAHHTGGCYYMGTIRVTVNGTTKFLGSSATPTDAGCVNIGPGTVQIIPLAPGSWAVNGSRGDS